MSQVLANIAALTVSLAFMYYLNEESFDVVGLIVFLYFTHIASDIKRIYEGN